MAATHESETVKQGVDLEAFHEDDLSEGDAEILAEGAKRSPVWNLMRLPHEMVPVVDVQRAIEADD
jgi:hypothetical protein